MSKNIAVIGTGATGSVIGGLLTAGGHDVTMIDQWRDAPIWDKDSIDQATKDWFKYLKK